MTVKTRDEALPQMTHWPYLPGEPVADGDLDLYALSRHRGRCNQRRNGWICTRQEEHSLPHVAVGGRVIAVWDQSWYWDTQGDPTLTHEVAAEGRLVYPIDLRERMTRAGGDPF